MTGTWGRLTRISTSDIPAFGGGIINSDDRDREIFGQRLRLGYDVSPDMNVFVEGRLNQVRYDLQPPAVPNSRDSDGFAVQGGVTFAITRLVSGEVAVGYLEQEYDSPAFPDVSGLAYNADISWSMTPLTTVTFGAGSSVDESTSVGVGGRLSQYARVGIDHELMRNVQIGGAVRFQNDDFEGSPQNEDYFDAGIGVRYLMNRNVSLRLDTTTAPATRMWPAGTTPRTGSDFPSPCSADCGNMAVWYDEAKQKRRATGAGFAAFDFSFDDRRAPRRSRMRSDEYYEFGRKTARKRGHARVWRGASSMRRGAVVLDIHKLLAIVRRRIWLVLVIAAALMAVATAVIWRLRLDIPRRPP